MASDLTRGHVVIAGGGPAGMVAGLLLARAGVPVLVLEKHADFFRDFRGDTVHPSTLDLFAQIGLDDSLLRRPHERVEELSARIGGRDWQVADFRHLPVRHPFIALMPQWEFLDVIREAGRALPQFTLRMEAEVTGIVTDTNGRVSGVTLADGSSIAADLVIAADGRHSTLRSAAGLTVRQLGAPIDVFWFRLPKDREAKNRTVGVADRGHFLVTIDRGEYWQVGYVFPKGRVEALRAAGLDAFRAGLARIAPDLAPVVDALRSWDDVFLLSVALDRLEQWHRPGLLAIGDAAHAMSPIGGVGINLAVQDAVAAANVLARALATGQPVDALLPQVAERRLGPTRRMQALQKAIQDRVIVPTMSAAGNAPLSAPWPLRLLDAVPLLRRIPARIVGLGFGRERLEI